VLQLEFQETIDLLRAEFFLTRATTQNASKLFGFMRGLAVLFV
jgi:hypothetical protein